MIEVTRRTYETISKILSIAAATILLILGFAIIVYITSSALEYINSRGGASNSIMANPGLNGLLSVFLIVLAAGIGVMISIPYAVYVIDKLRSKGKSIPDEEI